MQPLFEFAMNHGYKLYRDGQFYDLARDPSEQSPLASDSLSVEASAAHRLLTGALAKYRDARPPALEAEAGPRKRAKQKRGT